ncbi:MAG TPA: GGDEF domain-containing protein [Gemmataceae bacterium]|nr:GGDEF domain-containing protein [Gemmataceae bacterium]
MSNRTSHVVTQDLTFVSYDRKIVSRPSPAVDSPEHREALLARIVDNPYLVSPPGIVLRLLEQASHLDCTPTDLAAVLHRDPALCGKILKAVNSVFYGLPRSITSINRAVALLGLKAVRSLVLSLSLPVMQSQFPCKPPFDTFWKASVAGAIVAHELALKLHRPNPEDDLMAGLLRDLGLLALQQVYATDAARLLAYAESEGVLDPCQQEERLLGINHADVGAVLLHRWRLPEDITEAIRYHHAPERAVGLPSVVAERARLLAFASHIAQLQLSGGATVLRETLVFAHRHYDLNEAGLRAFLEPIAQKIDDFASLMNIEVGVIEHYPRILARAAEELVKLTIETNMDKLRILEQQRQAEQEAQHWREQALHLHQESLRDALTGAFNRGCFEVELFRQFRRARRRGTVLGLVFLDLDDFKHLNDRFGHPFGDRVLKETADKLFDAVRYGDTVARYGGDEFCILVENTSPEGLRAMADRLGEDLNSQTLDSQGHSVVIRASIGAVLCLPRTYSHSAAEFLAAADQAMYAGKATGKNQITLVSLLSDADLLSLRAVEGWMFSAWLSERGVWKPRYPREGMRRAGSRFGMPSRLAYRLGWLTTEQRQSIVREQRTTRRCFDEVALARGWLTPSQWHTLLALQLEPPEDLAANLVMRGDVEEVEMRDNLHKYYQHLITSFGERPASAGW